MQMRRIFWLMIVLMGSLAACRATEAPNGAAEVPQAASPKVSRDTYTLELAEAPANFGDLKMNLDQLGAFHARFVLRFEGNSQWMYQVDTRSDGTNTEYQLIIEGLSDSMDLGDVRLVNSLGQNFMAGPATDGACIQFPDTFVTEPMFLGPTEFIHLKELSHLPGENGIEAILGRETTRYTAVPQPHMGWQDVSISFWLDTQTQSVLKYEFFASGNDPLYYQGDGTIHGLFELLEIGPQEIAAVPDCGIEFPLPGDVTGLIHFPGLISFTSGMGEVELEGFFTNALESRGWLPGEFSKNDQTKDVMLDYTSQEKAILIHLVPINVEDLAQGYQVEIYYPD
jgi:hypothetical protein